MAISRRALFGKLDLTLFRALESATAFAKLRGNPHVELVHWLHQLSQANDGDFQRISRRAGIDPAVLMQDFQAALHDLPTGATSLVDFSHHLCEAVERAWILSSLQFDDNRIRGAWLLAALLKAPDLRAQLLATSPALRVLASEHFADTLPAIVAGSPESHEAAYDGSGLRPAMPEEASEAVAPPTGDGSALEKYTIDMTALAANGEIDPVVGREPEIRTAIDILLRRRQNNPLLTGDAGVGKTAVVEGLALAIATGSVPPQLRDVRLLSLDVGALIAGASMRGEFESRLKRLLWESRQSPRPVVIFVDEIHTLVGAGGQAGTSDAANLLKPALARGGLRAIGATTWSEYKRHIEKDPALTRRFQVLQVPEPAEQAAIDMLRGLVRTFASHHGVLVLDEAVRAAVLLSQRYIPARQLPDKAISLLDTACARVAMSLHTPSGRVQSTRQRVAALQCEVDLLAHEAPVVQGQVQREQRLEAARDALHAARALLDQQEQKWREEGELVQAVLRLRSQTADAAVASELESLEHRLQALQGDTPQVHPQVDEAVVAAIVADWTGIPAGRMLEDEAGAVLGLHARLAQRVLGQDRALAVIAQRVQTSRAGLTDPNKPVGVFLLVGPSGVGKTETALALADALYGGEQNLITINMSEYQEPHTVSSLKGSPPGYVGYGEGGVLTEAVRRRPHSVILLDEVEKAHPDVHELFYQVFDKGWMEDGEGRRIDFRHSTVLLTSNAGSALIDMLCNDPALVPDCKALREALHEPLRQVFPAAFLGRLSVVPYLPLGRQILQGIAQLQIDRVVQRMQAVHGIALECGPGLVPCLVQQCGTHEAGARRLIELVEQQVLPPLSKHWLEALEGRRTIRRMVIDARAPGSADPTPPDQGGHAITCQIDYA